MPEGDVTRTLPVSALFRRSFPGGGQSLFSIAAPYVSGLTLKRFSPIPAFLPGSSMTFARSAAFNLSDCRTARSPVPAPGEGCSYSVKARSWRKRSIQIIVLPPTNRSPSAGSWVCCRRSSIF